MRRQMKINEAIVGVAAERPRGRGRPPVHGTREEILAAAVRAAAGRGLEGLTMAGLADALGCTPYVLTYHFGTRDRLVEEIVEHVEEQLRGDVARWARDASASPGEVLRHYWHDLPIHDLPGWFRLWLEAVLQASRRDGDAPGAAPGFGRRMMEGWADTVGGAVGLDGDDPRVTLTVAALIGLELLETAAPGRDDADHVLALLDGLLAGAPR